MLRINGVGTNKLINRVQEEVNYNVLKGQKIADKIISISYKDGYKLTEFINGASNCCSDNWSDVEKAIKKLRYFHSLKLKVNHYFDIFAEIDFYESLVINGSKHKDYKETKEKLMNLKPYIKCRKEDMYLAHIDSVPDNFLITEDDEVYLIDWEYGAMCDQYIDIAMFALYSGYNKEQTDKLINIYCEGIFDNKIKYKVYSYIALGGLLWSNWCEYKESLGEVFGEYSQQQYNLAKIYSDYVLNSNKIRG